MCRIAGIITREVEGTPSGKLTDMLASIARGGPDDQGVYENGCVSLGHRRLSIIDLSQGGHQPKITIDHRLIITFNGEIYNYKELKKELQSIGAVFYSASDTEVILEAYRYWGRDSFDRFQGMFAFTLFDRSENKIFLVRDAEGIKPLYYSLDDQKLVFASEVKAFLAFDDQWPQWEDWRPLFLAFGSLPHPYTTLENVYALPPGHFLELDLKSFSTRIQSFTKELAKDRISDSRVALDGIHAEMKAALRRHMISDAPLGVFLSGGIDSSLLTLLADKEVHHDLSTVSVNFEEASFNERPFQDIVMSLTKQARQRSYTVNESEFWERLPDIWRAMDQPTVDGVNMYFVSKLAREAGLKAVLSGLGADEYFGGYASFGRVSVLKFLRWLPLKGAIANILGIVNERFRRIVFLKLKGPIGDYLFLRGLYTPGQISKILGCKEEKVWMILRSVPMRDLDAADNKEYASSLESEIYMRNQLLKDADFMSMWHGLEVRVPFLDNELVRLTKHIDSTIRFRNDRPKFLLTEAFNDLLPDEIVLRKKSGFTFPFATWIRNNSARFKELLPAGSLPLKIENGFLSGKTHWSKYWSLVVLENFSRR